MSLSGAPSASFGRGLIAREANRAMSNSTMRVIQVAADKIAENDQNTMERSGRRGRSAQVASQKVKFEIFGEEMLEKEVKLSGSSGRVYLPPDWVGHRVKIVRID